MQDKKAFLIDFYLEILGTLPPFGLAPKGILAPRLCEEDNNRNYLLRDTNDSLTADVKHPFIFY